MTHPCMHADSKPMHADLESKHQSCTLYPNVHAGVGPPWNCVQHPGRAPGRDSGYIATGRQRSSYGLGPALPANVSSLHAERCITYDTDVCLEAWSHARIICIASSDFVVSCRVIFSQLQPGNLGHYQWFAHKLGLCDTCYLHGCINPCNKLSTFISTNKLTLQNRWRQDGLNVIKAGKMVVIGPVTLVQGGFAAIAQQPIFISGKEFVCYHVREKKGSCISY